MNNDATPKLPDVPEQVEDWPLHIVLHECNVDFGVDDDAKYRYRLARRVLLEQISLMSNTLCEACTGFGHVAKDCPTNTRLNMLGSTGLEARKLMAYARQEAQDRNKEGTGLSMEPPSHHQVPR